jgi:hypothetical protein
MLGNDKQNVGKTVARGRHKPVGPSSFVQNSNIVGDGKDYIYDDERLDLKNVDICQFERNPHR